MTTFFTDSDLTGSGEFVEAEVWLATKFTIPSGLVTPRWRWPTVASAVTPKMRIFDSGGTLVNGTVYDFDTTTLDAWNSSPQISLSAGTYRFTINTTRYVAKSGFFSGGSVTRGEITGVESNFGSPGSAPTSTSTATYFIDIDLVTTLTATTTMAATEAMTASGTVVYPADVTMAATEAMTLAGFVGLGGVVEMTGSQALSLAGTVSGGATPAGSWDGLQSVVDYARAVHAQQELRDADPVECPDHRWPLTPVPGKRAWHCQFGGHVVYRGRG